MVLVLASFVLGCGGDRGKAPTSGESGETNSAKSESPNQNETAKKSAEEPGTDAPTPREEKRPGPTEPDGEKPNPKTGDGDKPTPKIDEKPAPATEQEARTPPASSSWASQRNGDLKQGVAGSTLPKNLVPLWKKEVKYGIPSASAIVGDHVYVPTLLGFLYCLDRRTGDEVWAYRSVPPEEKFAPGFKAPPTVTADAVYTGDEDGLVHAIDRRTGEKKWIFETGGEVAGGPTLVDDGRAIVVGSHGGGLVKLGTADGKPLWQVGEIGPINLSPPVVDGRTFALGCETGALVTVDVATGEEKARFPLEQITLATPAVWKDRMYLATHEGQVHEIDYTAGEITWTFEPKRPLAFESSCAVTEEAVYAAGKNRQLHKIDRKTGEEIWAFSAEAQILCSPVVVGDRVFIASDDQHLYGIDTRTGEEVYKFNLQESVKADPVVGEGVLVVGTEGSPGAIFCFGAKPE